MRQLSNTVILLFIIVMSFSAATYGDVPPQLTYQGLLTDGVGDPVADGTYKIQFRIWDDETVGSTLWDSFDREIAVVDGLFSYNLGDTIAIPSSIFESSPDLWVGIKVDGDPEISPRTKLTSVGYAFEANHADTADFATTAFNSGMLNSQSAVYYLEWTHLVSMPAGFADGIDDTATSIEWSGLTGVPAGFADGTDDVGGMDTAFADSSYVNIAGDIMTGALQLPSIFLGTGSTQTGYLNMYSSADASPVVSAGTQSAVGGYLHLKGPGGAEFLRLEPDLSTGYGGYFGVARNSGDTLGFIVDGNYANTEKPLVLITGGSQYVAFNMATSGSGTVVLPDDAIHHEEIINEPGIAFERTSAFTSFTQGALSMVDILTVSITTPTSGYIVVEACVNTYTQGTSGYNQCYTQIDETSGGSTITGHNKLWGQYGFSDAVQGDISHTRVYYKSAGTYTFRVEGKTYSSNGVGAVTSALGATVGATFYSTSYGTVETVVANPGDYDNAKAVSVEDIDGNITTVYEVDLRDLEIRATRARLEAERLERELVRAQANPNNKASEIE